jgi:hypothetical protein
MSSSMHKVFDWFFCWLFAFVFSLGYVYLCSYLPCTFAGWVPILEFYFKGFFFVDFTFDLLTFFTYGALTFDVKSVLNENLGGILGGTHY